ncbi:DUF3105 domain-containing protein [Kribbella sandramycini]|uniref:DUF3105 domain-containing protein n=1 Tax=Kribbella sandramycini TaxID=60450 RepID=A0A7Y4KY12_9ACTN|nr:DUF3105 domain-containing protein [Kribbella sandramycini]MBB6567450.1 hypothetical protein [Kribbella sandramycini]NOL39941.1 DUF3105 domain-containing protein [Kribbella sandramycini]
MRQRAGLLVGILVTTLSVITMSSFAFGVLLGQFTDREALPCNEVPGTPQPFEGNRHLAYSNAPHDPYRTDPPTSGPHSPRVVIPGIYRSPIPPELQVHILEHGHVLLQYAPGTSPADIDRLERVGRRHPRDVVVAPHPTLSTGIALTAWQRLQKSPTIDADAIESFVTKVAGRYDHQWRNGATDCLTS